METIETIRAKGLQAKAKIDRISRYLTNAQIVLSKGISERNREKIELAARGFAAVERAAKEHRAKAGKWPFDLVTYQNIQSQKCRAAEALGISAERLSDITKNARLKEA